MIARPIHRSSFGSRTVCAILLLFVMCVVRARAQQRPAESAAAAAAEQAMHPARLSPARRAPPFRRPVGSVARPVPLPPPVLPRPIPPAVRPSGVEPMRPSAWPRTPRSLVPQPLGSTPLRIGQPLPRPIPIRRPRAPLAPTVLPNRAPFVARYCSPLSVLYNTGSICFNPDIFTINPALLPWGLYVPPPLVDATGELRYSPFPPAPLLQYCPECALKNAGTGAARGLPRTESAAPSSAASVFVAPSESPYILVLKNGERPLISRYWLGRDWMLHFVTVGGQKEAISLNQLNLNATGTVNFQRGVVFTLPGWPNP